MKNLESEILQLKKEVEEIQARNRRVEADKAWEVSRMRTGFIGTVTFVFVLIFLLLIRDERPVQNSIIATIGYFLSTETYGILKRWWLARRNKL